MKNVYIMTKTELDNKILKACKEQLTMMSASKQVGIPYTTFKLKAIKLDVWKPNQGSKGIYVKSINELLKSKTIRPQILKNRLYEENIKTPFVKNVIKVKIGMISI